MNSEELEQSLRTEFEGYLKTVLSDFRQEVSGLQDKIEAEFQKHKSQIDTMFQDLGVRVENDRTLDEGFRESIVEHLRLARDEGARITAEAITEAEKLREETAPAANFSEMRDAINDITSKDSQAEILKALVNHAARYTPRGAFFIVKNEHFVGWRVFGTEAHEDDQAVREVFFPIKSSTVLSEAVNTLKSAEGAFGTYSDDAVYLNKLDFGKPDRMYAVPLVARGRGVAVLYADYGHEGTRVDIEALETLVHIAGLTVELLAANRGAKSQTEAKPAAQYTEKVTAPASQDYFPEKAQSFSSYEVGAKKQEEYSPAASVEVGMKDYISAEGYPGADEYSGTDFAFKPSVQQEETPIERDYQTEPSYQVEQDNFAVSDYSAETESPTQSEFQTVYDDTSSWNQPAPSFEENAADYSPAQFSPTQEAAQETSAFENPVPETDYSISADDYKEPISNYQFETQPSSEPQETPQFEDYSNQPQETPRFDDYSNQTQEAPQFGTNGSFNAPVTSDFQAPEPPFESPGFQQEQQPSFNQPSEPVVQSAAPAPVKTRFSERNTDLPIEVTDEERRLHNDARRFARLLVSEIKLYNEQKVIEGRQSQDLYERLREAIDRSREMYDKRVQPPVASKFDYFHYELVNTLAEGDEAKLGTSYPGAEV